MNAAKRTLLSVNVDHVATLRQARRAPYPQPVEAARLAEEAGASGITVHLREDRRHIQDHDLTELSQTVNGKLNVEIAATEAMIRIALDARPGQVTLVPERPDEITTEGGLDLLTNHRRVQRAASQLAGEGIDVSLFVDPDEEQILCAAEIEDVSGFEINTDAYSRCAPGEADAEVEQIQKAAITGEQSGLRVYAGHGLTSSNVAPVVAVPEIEELNIGHWVVSRSVAVGMKAAVEELLRAISVAQPEVG